MTLETLRRFFTSGHVLHMEREIDYLRGQNAQLSAQLREALKPTAAAPRPARTLADLPKVKSGPLKTAWDVYVEEQMALQEIEASKDGAHSSGREQVDKRPAGTIDPDAGEIGGGREAAGKSVLETGANTYEHGVGTNDGSQPLTGGIFRRVARTGS